MTSICNAGPSREIRSIERETCEDGRETPVEQVPFTLRASQHIEDLQSGWSSFQMTVKPCPIHV